MKYGNIGYNIQPKIPKYGFFGPKFRDICFFFPKIFQLDKFEGRYIEYDNILVKFQSKQYQSNAFLVQIKAFCFFLNILQLHKFDGGYCKYDKILWKF